MFCLYMDLEQLCYKYFFDFLIELDDFINLDECLIFLLFIQFLLENVIWYGIVVVVYEWCGYIWFGICKEVECLVVIVIDNGQGIKLKDGEYELLVIKIIEE